MYLLYVGANFFAVIGGAQSMASSGILLDRSTYEPLDESQTAGFYTTADEGKMSRSNVSLNAEAV